jgi:hypothetical protein
VKAAMRQNQELSAIFPDSLRNSPKEQECVKGMDLVEKNTTAGGK